MSKESEREIEEYESNYFPCANCGKTVYRSKFCSPVCELAFNAEEEQVFHIEFDVIGDISLLVHDMLTLGEQHWKVVGGADGLQITEKANAPEEV